jgi:hypothetical protein
MESQRKIATQNTARGNLRWQMQKFIAGHYLLFLMTTTRRSMMIPTQNATAT